MRCLSLAILHEHVAHPNPAVAPQVSLESQHQPTASRFAAEGRNSSSTGSAALGLRPRPPGSAGSGGGGSSASTPHSCGVLSGAGGAPLPHPLQLARKLSNKASGMPLLPETSSSSPVAPGCSSPVPTVPGDGTPGGSFRRRRSYNRVPVLAGLHMSHLIQGSACSSPNSPPAALALAGGALPFRGSAPQLQLQPPGSTGVSGCSAGSAAGGGAFAGGGLSSCATAFSTVVGSPVTAMGIVDEAHVGPPQQAAPIGASASGGYGVLPTSRPTSARSKAVQTLVEAVRSKVSGVLLLPPVHPVRRCVR